MKKDPLYLFIRKHVDASSTHDFDQLLVEAVGDYMASLMEKGFIPHSQMDLVEESLMEEAWDILRKMTYGKQTPSPRRRA